MKSEDTHKLGYQMLKKNDSVKDINNTVRHPRSGSCSSVRALPDKETEEMA